MSTTTIKPKKPNTYERAKTDQIIEQAAQHTHVYAARKYGMKGFLWGLVIGFVIGGGLGLIGGVL